MLRFIVAATTVLLTSGALPIAQDHGTTPREGLVVCTSAPACDAGAAVLARGGNAVDAAVATAVAADSSSYVPRRAKSPRSTSGRKRR
jgi:hypothetical protein